MTEQMRVLTVSETPREDRESEAREVIRRERGSRRGAGRAVERSRAGTAAHLSTSRVSHLFLSSPKALFSLQLTISLLATSLFLFRLCHISALLSSE